MQKYQKLFFSALYAIIEACTTVTGEVRAILTRALVLILSENRELNLQKRELLRLHLNSQYAALCTHAVISSTQLSHQKTIHRLLNNQPQFDGCS